MLDMAPEKERKTRKESVNVLRRMGLVAMLADRCLISHGDENPQKASQQRRKVKQTRVT